MRQDAIWGVLAARIEDRTGIDFTLNRIDNLKLGLESMTGAMGFSSVAECQEWLLSEPWNLKKTQACGIHLTVSETYFFREPDAFEVLADYLRQRLLQNPARTVRLWSAACCTGEEPYSMAIAAKESVPSLTVSVRGTDLNPAAVQTARKACYRRWAFRGVSPHIKNMFFTPTDHQHHCVIDDIRRLVKFDTLNLAEATYPSPLNQTDAVDVIFLRNVLIYFSEDTARQVVRRLYDCLVEGGLLIVGQCELSQSLFTGFEEQRHRQFIYYRKPTLAVTTSREARPTAYSDSSALTSFSDLSVSMSPAPEWLVPDVTLDAPRKSQPEPATRQTTTPDVMARFIHLEQRLNQLIRQQDLVTAEHELDAAIKESPLDERLHFLKALLCLTQEDQAGALPHLQKVLYLNPDDAAAQYLQGVLRLKSGGKDNRAQLEQFLLTLSSTTREANAANTAGLSLGLFVESVRDLLSNPVEE